MKNAFQFNLKALFILKIFIQIFVGNIGKTVWIEK